MDRALHLVVVVLVVAVFAGSGQANGLPNHLAASGTTCRILALSHQEWPTMLDWYLAGDIKKLPSREAARDPCRPVEPKARARKPNRD